MRTSIEMETRHGRYLTLRELEKGVEIELTEEGREEVMEKDGDYIDYVLFADLFEDIQCNSEWEMLSAEEIGALTSCEIILCKDGRRNENGELMSADVIYWHANYQVENFIEELLKGPAILPKG